MNISYRNTFATASLMAVLLFIPAGAQQTTKSTFEPLTMHLPEVGVKGNTHFPFSDLNNQQVADMMSKFLAEKKLD